jgi:uncharacterized membrane protein
VQVIQTAPDVVSVVKTRKLTRSFKLTEIVIPEQSDDPPGVFGDDAARPGMRTMRWVASYFASFVIFVGVDFLWLSAMVGRVYRPTMGDIALANVNFPPAIVFYGLYPIGLLMFAVAPAVKAESLLAALLYGALFGFFTYATYDLTNQATLRNWTMELSLIDMGWGTGLAACAAAVGYLVASWF